MSLPHQKSEFLAGCRHPFPLPRNLEQLRSSSSTERQLERGLNVRLFPADFLPAINPLPSQIPQISNPFGSFPLLQKFPLQNRFKSYCENPLRNPPRSLKLILLGRLPHATSKSRWSRHSSSLTRPLGDQSRTLLHVTPKHATAFHGNTLRKSPKHALETPKTH